MFALRSAVKKFGKRIEEVNKRLTFGALGRLLNVRTRRGPIDPAHVRSLLVLRNDRLGDMVVSTPIWRLVKRYAPHIRVGVAASRVNRELIANDPDVDVVFDLTETSLAGMMQKAGSVRKEQWDIVLPLVYSRKTKSAVLARLCAPRGITTMIVSERLERYRKLFDIVAARPAGSRRAMVEIIRDHLRAVLAIPFADAEWLPSLIIDPVVETATRRALTTWMSSASVNEFVLINVSAGDANREWGIANCVALAKTVVEKFPGVGVILTASLHARGAVEAARGVSEDRIVCWPTANVHELVTVVRHSSLVVSPDTALVHIAGAEQKPVVGLYLFENEWLPQFVDHEVIIAEDPSLTLGSIPFAPVAQSVERMVLRHFSMDRL